MRSDINIATPQCGAPKRPPRRSGDSDEYITRRKPRRSTGFFKSFCETTILTAVLAFVILQLAPIGLGAISAPKTNWELLDSWKNPSSESSQSDEEIERQYEVIGEINETENSEYYTVAQEAINDIETFLSENPEFCQIFNIDDSCINRMETIKYHMSTYKGVPSIRKTTLLAYYNNITNDIYVIKPAFLRSVYGGNTTEEQYLIQKAIIGHECLHALLKDASNLRSYYHLIGAEGLTELVTHIIWYPKTSPYECRGCGYLLPEQFLAHIYLKGGWNDIKDAVNMNFDELTGVNPASNVTLAIKLNQAAALTGEDYDNQSLIPLNELLVRYYRHKNIYYSQFDLIIVGELDDTLKHYYFSDSN